jgi:hypothetical protein
MEYEIPDSWALSFTDKVSEYLYKLFQEKIRLTLNPVYPLLSFSTFICAEIENAAKLLSVAFKNQGM